MPTNLENSAVAIELEKVSFHSNQPQRKAMPKNVQTTTQLHSSHMLAKQCSKFSKPGFNSMWTVNFQMFKLDLEKAEEPEIKLQIKKEREFQKSIDFCFIDYTKAFDFWIITIYGKFFKRWEFQTTLPVSWEICMLVKTQQLELDMVRNLYAGQDTTARVGHGTKDWFQTGKGEHQGCI